MQLINYRIVGSEIRQGMGKFIDFFGNIYEGWFHENERSGKGREVDADGDIYEGQWKDDKKHGKGV